MARFHSILFERPGDGADPGQPHEPPFFADLNLDQVLESMVRGREEYDLKPFFYVPLHDASAVQYRHEVLRDLEKNEVSGSVDDFAEKMREVRKRLGLAGKLYYRYQKERWFLDAVDTYCDAVVSFAEALARLDLTSRGFQALRGYLTGYARSDGFTSLVGETRSLKGTLGEIQYSVHIKGNRVRVSPFDGEDDYSAEVEDTFAKFKQGPVKDYRERVIEHPDMDHVEAQVLDLVARLNPEVFSTLDNFCARHGDFIDDTIRGFDREVQFYLAYLQYIAQFKAAGLPFCYPHVSAGSTSVHANDAFDLALANTLVPDHGTVVCNDFALEDPERILVVTGPNQGGKTTFARMFGQLHHLASLGLPVPGNEARLLLPDGVFSHFEREEDLDTLRGKLDDELVRVHEILDRATSDSVLVMNESFTSTTLNDALYLGTEILGRITQLGSLCVYVTFVDELTSLSDATVSMVSTVVPDNPAERTYKIVRKAADGLAYAAAIARKYGLSYESVRERVGP